jgi:metalloendopeptidase OMA1, mitochondrial
MNRHMAFSPLLLAVLWAAGCSTVPYTGRKQLSIVSADEENQLGLTAFQDVKTKNKISTDPQLNALVQRVGKRIAAAANQPSWDWQFVVIEDPKTVNAFCLPGGRIAVYTGILPLTKDENGLAVVLGHETSHALAHHGAERMSETSLVSAAAQIAGQSGVSDTALQGFNIAYGVGRGLPHSRAQESEADHIGLILMAKAGYDPQGAVPFWQRMAQLSGGNAPPAFLSDHPSDAQRVQKIKDEMPEALTYFTPRP